MEPNLGSLPRPWRRISLSPLRHPPAYLPRRCLLCFVARRGEAAISPAVGCDWVLGLPPPGLGREILGMARS